ncbi:hypothetical protein E2P84_31070 [Burkholderia cepacia]|uniref:Uncharacterized protein n=1 Tax=Burkholderia cepacia TaxID=292 RepID=A0AAX2REE1_BURCE|nr:MULTISPECIES: hypothetical protein [Burkholderia cepacia complex]MCA7889836.1 hypothetical protein [Burkholderia contaminans]MDN7577299.1 hypothetical protein [Burkholderia contaminans]TES70132.1 hypothetical protein E2P84_31070 [Burkholderia cepacia]TES97432.1 hypothetical protein E3D36_32285 [Burkholderia cepacia]TEU35261.1 hypothetical protein E3D37_37625 [Burkholderia cepacia]
MEIPVPDIGNRSYERILKVIQVKEVVGPGQVTKFVSARHRCRDPINSPGRVFDVGQLQQRDLRELRAQCQFEYPDFIVRTILNSPQFDSDEARVFQFHRKTSSSQVIYGTVITDSELNLVDYCIGGPRLEQRRSVLHMLLRALCTPRSIEVRLH